MAGCDLREAKLSGVDLNRTNLMSAQFDEAVLFAADLRGANLRGARGMSSLQLSQARTDSDTTLPNGSRGPYLRGSGAEKPG
jgi:uncharacterized protein YjbI with pentapeptide repeats